MDGGSSGAAHAPLCKCGRVMNVNGHETRDIIEYIPARYEEVRHKTQTATCACGSTAVAENGLPASGSYGRELVGLVAALRAERIPLDRIPAAVDAACPGLKIAKSTVTNILARVGDALEETREEIAREVKESDCVYIDETGGSMDGTPMWVWVMRSDSGIHITYHRSRGAYVMDRWMDGFLGVAVTDLYRVYFTFDPGGMHQLCWTHQLRRARHDADASGDPDVRRLHTDMNGMFVSALDALDNMSHSALLRHRMEYMLDAVLEPYRTICRGSDNKRLAGLISYIEMAAHGLFAFLEHPGVEPTNNDAERALRYVVVFRKISGQLKGGADAMRRMSNFVTCVLTWRLRGKSVAQEVARLV